MLLKREIKSFTIIIIVLTLLFSINLYSQNIMRLSDHNGEITNDNSANENNTINSENMEIAQNDNAIPNNNNNAVPETGEVLYDFDSVIRKFGNISLGMDRQEVLENMDAFFEVDYSSSFGDLDRHNKHVLKARSVPEIPHIYYQFYNTALNETNYFSQDPQLYQNQNYILYEILVNFDPEYLNFHRVYYSLVQKYGPADIMRPLYAEWEPVEEQNVRIILLQESEETNAYVTVKYIHEQLFQEALLKNGIIDNLMDQYEDADKENQILNRL